ncbi:MAG: WG repeat-containing protein [Prevotella sp.]|nr:WG repeat-containing protein [Prevotella sp.]
MRKFKVQTLLTIVSMSVAVILFTGCGKKSKSPFNFDYLPVQMSKGDSWSIIDKNGKEVVQEEYPADAALSLIYEGTYWVYSNGKYQLYNIKNPKKPVIDEEFTTATAFNSGVAVVGNPNQVIRIINTNGKIVATLGKDIRLCRAFNDEGYAEIINTDDKHGLIDTKGNIVITPTYACLYTPSDGLIIALKEAGDSKALILDMKGNKQGEINRDKYHLLDEQFHEGKIPVRDADDDEAHTVILDKTGNKLFDIKKAKEGYNCSVYQGGYMTFYNGDTFGVVDDKGEIIIRPKYKGMLNLGNGYFAARKDEKCGIVNADDETVIDFDYKDVGFTMGDNFVMRDGSSFSLVDRNGKEITSFAVVNAHADEYVEYVDVTSLINSIYTCISDYEQGITPEQLAEQLSLSLDDFHYRSYIRSHIDADGKVSMSLSSSYGSYVAEQQSHEEEVSDGWFTTTRTVIDGWNWSKEIPNSVSGTITLTDSSLNLEDFYKALLEKLAVGRSKVSDNVFTKNIDVDGSTIECRTTLEQNYDDIGIEIEFRQ